jgi:hypothetical protein
MFKTTAIVAVSLIATLAQADAAKRHHHHHYARGVNGAPVVQVPYGHYAPRVSPGPAWAGPNECWTDEGYGRYAPCSGRSVR